MSAILGRLTGATAVNAVAVVKTVIDWKYGRGGTLAKVGRTALTIGLAALYHGSDWMSKRLIKQEEALAALAQELMTPEMNEQERVSITDVLRRTSVAARKGVAAAMKKLMNEELKDLDVHKRVMPICALVLFVPADEWKDVIALVTPLLTDKLTGMDIGVLIGVVSKVLPEDRKDVIALVTPLLTDKLTGTDIALLIGVVNLIPAAERQKVMALVTPSLTDKMTGEDIARRIQIVLAERKLGMNKNEGVVAVEEEFVSDEPGAEDLEGFESANLSDRPAVNTQVLMSRL